MQWVYNRVGRCVSPYVFLGFLRGARVSAFFGGWVCVALAVTAYNNGHSAIARGWLGLFVSLLAGTWLSRDYVVSHQERLFRCLRWYVDLPRPWTKLVLYNAPEGLQRYLRQRLWIIWDQSWPRVIPWKDIKQLNNVVCAELDLLAETKRLRLESHDWVFNATTTEQDSYVSNSS